jgi:hypothetical protein
MLIRDWPNEGEIAPFPSSDKQTEFAEMIRKSNFLPAEIIDLIIQRIDRATIGEMYAFLVDREAKRKYRPERISSEDQELTNRISSLTPSDLVRVIEEYLNSAHRKGFILAVMLEQLIPDYNQRKEWLKHLMEEEKQD